MFHSKVATTLADMPVIPYLDDLIVGDKNKLEHNNNLRLMLQRIDSLQMHVNADKMRVGSLIYFHGS